MVSKSVPVYIVRESGEPGVVGLEQSSNMAKTFLVDTSAVTYILQLFLIGTSIAYERRKGT